MNDLWKLRIAKLAACVVSPQCWHGLCLGVAPSIEHRRVLRDLSPDAIIDVGANRGQFALMCKLLHPHTPIVSFEPLPREADTFKAIHGKRKDIRLLQCALGETPGSATLHISQSADSSSLLPIGRKQTELFQNTAEVGTIEVEVNRLDDLDEHWHGKNKLLLKIDVQGFELPVLRGAIRTLKRCAYVYVECSEIPLYEGQELRKEVEDFLTEHGFRKEGPHNEHILGGKLIQADYLFARPIG